jgi:hypothetical protein
LIYKCGGPSMPRTLTKEQVRQVDDSDIWQQLKVCLDVAGRNPSEGPGDQYIRTCAACAKSEKKLKSMKCCSKCRASFYCLRDCQVHDWPAHKKACKAAEAVVPRTGPFDLIEGGVRPDGTKILFKVFRDSSL